jgi:hypothetical protein
MAGDWPLFLYLARSRIEIAIAPEFAQDGSFASNDACQRVRHTGGMQDQKVKRYIAGLLVLTRKYPLKPRYV